MPPSLFITLPVKDVPKSLAFYEALGFKAKPEFTGEGVACVAISDTISVMLGSHEMFAQISPKPWADPAKGCQVLLSLTLESKDAVDATVKAAIAAGGSQAHEPEDHGFMYQWAFNDLDGNGWGLTAMTPTAA